MIRAARLLALALAFSIVSLSVLRWGGWWRVAEVRLSPTRYVALEQLTGFLLGANVLRLELRALHSAIQGDLRVLKAKIRLYPLARRVDVMIEERKPVVAVGLRDGRAFWVDAEGVLLEPAEQASLVGLMASEGRVAPEAVQAALALARWDVPWRPLYPTFDASDPQQVIARSRDGPTLLLGSIGQLADRLAILRMLWEPENLGTYAVVDLRGEDEVVLKRKR